MADDDYMVLAEQSEQLARQASDEQIAEGWRMIASGFRQLVRLHASGLRHWQARARERERRSEVPH
jgi:hypothetical protein